MQWPLLQETEGQEEVFVLVNVSRERLWVGIDTFALSILVKRAWYIRTGERDYMWWSGRDRWCKSLGSDREGRNWVWNLGKCFEEEIKVIRQLPEKFPVESRFWRKYRLFLDLEANLLSTEVRGTSFSEWFGKSQFLNVPEAFCRMMEGPDVDRYLAVGADYSEFLPDPHVTRKLHSFL